MLLLVRHLLVVVRHLFLLAKESTPRDFKLSPPGVWTFPIFPKQAGVTTPRAAPPVARRTEPRPPLMPVFVESTFMCTDSKKENLGVAKGVRVFFPSFLDR